MLNFRFYMKNKNFVFCFVLILLLFILSACESTEEGYRLYEDKSRGYSFEVPASWQQASIQNNDIAFVNSDQTMLLAVKTLDAQSDLSSYVDLMKTNIPTVLSGGVLLGEEKLSVAERNSHKLVVSYNAGNTDFKYALIMIEDKDKNRLLMLTYTTLLKEYERNYNIFQNVLSTLEF